MKLVQQNIHKGHNLIIYSCEVLVIFQVEKPKGATIQIMTGHIYCLALTSLSKEYVMINA